MKPEEIASIKARVEKEFLDRPGVTGVGVGYKEVGGQRTNEVAIIIYVKEKKPLAALTGAERVPPVIEGVKTDVKARKIELKNRFARLEDLRPKVDATNYGVLHGGISIGPCRSVHIAGDDVACQGVPGPGQLHLRRHARRVRDRQRHQCRDDAQQFPRHGARQQLECGRHDCPAEPGRRWHLSG